MERSCHMSHSRGSYHGIVCGARHKTDRDGTGESGRYKKIQSGVRKAVVVCTGLFPCCSPQYNMYALEEHLPQDEGLDPRCHLARWHIEVGRVP